jgi:hypothetical protein
MPTALNRRVTRRVSDTLVASLDAKGLILRRPRGRKRVLVTWEELDSEYLADARTSAEAFRRRLPARWLPKPGDMVWVKPKSHVWTALVRKVLHGCGEEIVVCRMAGRTPEMHVLLSRTRPMSSAELKRVVTPEGEI